ncbi:MAG: 3'(2'),5'-bisphosphate nucleotidase CysQ [Actinobacteria bacterium]|nr:3'(2'),5'-bisphosphate nucleotidase CysQ [Actinomycetota bacterium]MBO0788577.1 3'(2'),5'-bisphosphate nucleotidase CysQ [Actinomycetota bacterium]
MARDLAEEAGRRLLALRGSGAAELGKEGDRRSHEFLMTELARARPDDAILSEEGKDNQARLAADRVWIVDPLDGTREFGEAGRTDWAVHVALWERGELAAGAVALPAQGRVLSTAGPPAPAPAAPGPSAPAPAAPGQAGGGQRGLDSLRVVVSRSRPPEFAARLPVTLLPLGSAGAKAAAVICGDADAYVHEGGQYEWDSAAPVAVARAAGLHASRLDGSKLAYNQADPWLPDILICPGALAGPLLEAVRAARAGGRE